MSKRLGRASTPNGACSSNGSAFKRSCRWWWHAVWTVTCWLFHRRKICIGDTFSTSQSCRGAFRKRLPRGLFASPATSLHLLTWLDSWRLNFFLRRTHDCSSTSWRLVRTIRATTLSMRASPANLSNSSARFAGSRWAPTLLSPVVMWNLLGHLWKTKSPIGT